MRMAVRAALLFLALLGLVVALSTIYTRTLKPTPDSRPPSAAGLGSDPGELHPALSEGIEALNADRLDEARELLEAVPATDSGYALALNSLAELHRRAGDDEASLAMALEVSHLQPDNPEAQLALARVHYRMGHPDEAELCALRAIELAPEHPGAKYLVALFRTAQDDVAGAIRSYGRAIDHNPDQQHIFRALSDLQLLADASPDAGLPHYALAYFATRLGNSDLAEEELESYLRLSPEGAAADLARTKLVEIRLERGEATE